MFKWIKRRLKEPSTILGLSAVIGGVGTILKADYVPEIAKVVEVTAEPLSQGDYQAAITLSLGGLMAMFMSEKGDE